MFTKITKYIFLFSELLDQGRAKLGHADVEVMQRFEEQPVVLRLGAPRGQAGAGRLQQYR